MQNSSQRNKYNNNSRANHSTGYVYGKQQQGGASNISHQEHNNRRLFPSSSVKKASRLSMIMSTSRTRARDDDDNNSIGSSIYSQPSVMGDPDSGSNLHRQNTLESRRLELQDEEQQEYQNDEYPLSSRTASMETRGSTVILTSSTAQQQLLEQHEKNYYNDSNQGSTTQIDVYSDGYHAQDFDDEATRHNTLTSNAYLANSNLGDVSEDKNVRHSAGGEHELFVLEKNKKCSCCSRKICIIISFIILVVIGVGLFFIWPRVPSITIAGNTAASPGSSEPIISIEPSPHLQMDFTLSAMLDNRQNWIPFSYKKIDAQIYDTASLSTYSQAIATGNVNNYYTAPRSLSTFDINFNISYTPTTNTDPTLVDFIKACTLPNSTTTVDEQPHQQALLNVRVDLQMYIYGLDWIYKPSTSVSISDLKCPYSISLSNPPTPTAS